MSAGAAKALTSSGRQSHFELFGLAPAFGLDQEVLEKAYRGAEHIAARLKRESVARTPPTDLRAAARDLEALAEWCDGLTGLTPPAP